MQTVADMLGVSLGRKINGWCSDLFQADRTRRISVAALLQHAGWTQQQIGDELGVDERTIRRFFQSENLSGLTESDLHEAYDRLPEGVNLDLADATPTKKPPPDGCQGAVRDARATV